MAIANQPIPTGRVGDLIFYYYKGKLCTRTMPERVRQTKATKEAWKNFAVAVKLAKRIRWGLEQLYSDLEDSSIMNRLNGVVSHCLREDGIPLAGPLDMLHMVGTFRFNTECFFDRLFKKPLQISHDSKGITVVIPRFEIPKDIRAPRNTRRVVMKIGAVICNAVNDHYQPFFEHRVIQWTGHTREEETIEIRHKIGRQQFVIVGAALRYRILEEDSVPEPLAINKKREWMPADILYSAWTGK